ncbi:MAG: hypothetical protein LBI27_00015 [Clostridiales bacterium]|jgi:hypothetical protein|nr:hypothetical protein [Clostridiales bacterium]
METLTSNFIKIEPWHTPSIKELFDIARHGTSFRILYPELIHALTRRESLDVNMFAEPPAIYDEIEQEYYAFVACAVHYHFKKRELDVPSWVHYDAYKIPYDEGSKRNIYEHPILEYHNVRLSLRDLGEIAT